MFLKLDHNSGLHAKIREKFLVIKSEGFYGLLGGRKCEKGGGLYKEKGKCNIESRIEFTVPKLVSLDTPHGPITKFLKKCL